MTMTQATIRARCSPAAAGTSNWSRKRCAGPGHPRSVAGCRPGQDLDQVELGRWAVGPIGTGGAGIGKTCCWMRGGGRGAAGGCRWAVAGPRSWSGTRPFGRAGVQTSGGPRPRRNRGGRLGGTRGGWDRRRGDLMTGTSDPGLCFCVPRAPDLGGGSRVGGPPLTGVDDLQWADPSSLLTLSALTAASTISRSASSRAAGRRRAPRSWTGWPLRWRQQVGGS